MDWNWRYSAFISIHHHLTQPMDPEKKSLNFIFPTQYVIPKSLKFGHWLSESFKKYCEQWTSQDLSAHLSSWILKSGSHCAATTNGSMWSTFSLLGNLSVDKRQVGSPKSSPLVDHFCKKWPYEPLFLFRDYQTGLLGANTVLKVLWFRRYRNSKILWKGVLEKGDSQCSDLIESPFKLKVKECSC